MKVIVAGSRTIQDYNLVSTIISNTIHTYHISVDELVQGLAKGVDTLARSWALSNSIPPKDFLPKWDDITVPGALVRRNKWGKLYNVLAGHMRNEEMAHYVAANGGGALIAIWDFKSTGTKDMIHRAFNHKLFIYVYKTGSPNLVAIPLDTKDL